MSTPTQTDAAPGDQPPRKTPYDLRDEVSQCNDSDLTTFSKLLFTRLTDMAFKSQFKRGEGIVEASKKFLAEYFGVSPDTISRAARRLIKSGFVWTEIKWTGAHEMTWWFIDGWADDKFKHHAHTGSNFGRRITGVQRNTVRGEKGKFAANPDSERSQYRAWKAAQRKLATVKAGISPDHGQESALSGQTGNSGQGATVSHDQPQESALSAGSNQPGPTAGISPDGTVKSALTAGSNQPCPDGQMSGLNTLKSISGGTEREKGGTPPPPKASPAERLEEEFSAWCNMVTDLLNSDRRKLRDTLAAHRQRTPKGNVRDFLDRKIAFIDRLKLGPLPLPEPTPAPQPVITMKPERLPPETMQKLGPAMRAAANEGEQ